MIFSNITNAISTSISAVCNSSYSIVLSLFCGVAYVAIFLIYKKFKTGFSYILATLVLTYIQIFSFLSLIVSIGIKFNTGTTKSFIVGAVLFSVFDLILTYSTNKRINYLNFILILLISENLGNKLLLTSTILLSLITIFTYYYGKIYKLIIENKYSYLNDNLPWE